MEPADPTNEEEIKSTETVDILRHRDQLVSAVAFAAAKWSVNHAISARFLGNQANESRLLQCKEQLQSVMFLCRNLTSMTSAE